LIRKYPIHRDYSQGKPLRKIFHLYILYGIRKLELKLPAARLKGIFALLRQAARNALAFQFKKKAPGGDTRGKTAVQLMAVTAFLWTEPKRIWLIQ